MEPFTEGFFLQASLILALGAQNLFVLESGIRKRRQFLVASLCIFCDALLISLGVLGAATVFVQIPWLKILFGTLGVAFLGYYGLLKLKEKPKVQIKDGVNDSLFVPIGTVVMQTLAFSLLNPHVYLDTIILIGGYSTQFSSLFERFLFGGGAASFSLIWFFGLAFFAAAVSRYLNNSKMMRGVFVVSGLVLICLAVKLGGDVWQWYIESRTT